jgi:GntR family transcriptional repressor for pyruvate dehydrogenase complex
VTLRAFNKKKRIHEEIIAQVREELADRRLSPGDRLRSATELSEGFQVSRAFGREAIRALESTGFATSKIGEGTYVATDAEVLPSLLVSIILQPKDVLLGIFDAQKIIKLEIASLASKGAKSEEILHMEEILEEQARQIAQGDTGADADTAFHSFLTQSTKNNVFFLLNDALVDSLRETRERSLQIHGRSARCLDWHQQIRKAIRTRFPARAKQAMLQHLVSGLRKEETRSLSF